MKSRILTRLTGLAIYVGLAVWTTWPLALSPATTLPLGDLPVATVPLLNVWSMWWNADRLLAGGSGYWDAPIFHPASDTFAFSEPQPATLLVAPVLWLTGSRVLAYNVYLWVSLVLNGVFARRLLRVLGLKRLTAFAGGAAMLLLPLAHWQRDVVQLVPLWGILWTWTAAVKLSRRQCGPLAPRVDASTRGASRFHCPQSLSHALLPGIELGAAFGVTFLTCVHHGMFLALLLAAAVWTLWDRWLRLRTWLAVLAAAIVVAVLVGPVVVPLRRAAEKYEFERTPELVAQLSAMPGDYTAPWGRAWIDFGPLASRPDWTLSPGWLKVGLALVGITFGLVRRRWRCWTAFLLVTAVLAFLLSLGPHLKLGAWQPWWTLTEVLPGFSQVRNVFRFAFFVQMAAVLFAAQALYGLLLLNRGILARASHQPHQPDAQARAANQDPSLARRAGVIALSWIGSRRVVGGPLWRYATYAAIAALGLAMIFEVRPVPPKLASVPDAAANAGWIEFVRAETPAGRAIACLPFAAGNAVADFEVTAHWMYFGTFHGVPLVNGYSGFFPREYFEIRDAVNSSFPSKEILAWLADREVEFVVARRDWIAPEELDGIVTERVVVERVFSDPVGVDVYRLRRVE